MVDFIKQLFGIDKPFKSKLLKQLNRDILKYILPDETIAKLLIPICADTLTSRIPFPTTKHILNILCDTYRLKTIDKIAIDSSIRWGAGFRCDYDKDDIAKVTNTEILFRDESCLEVRIVFHEFAHYLDAMVNPYYRQTTTDGGTGGCNQIIPDTFAKKYLEALQKIEYKQAA